MTSTSYQARTALLYLTARRTTSLDGAVADFKASLAKAIDAGKLDAAVRYTLSTDDRSGLAVLFADGSAAFAVPTPKGRRFNWHSVPAAG